MIYSVRLASRISRSLSAFRSFSDKCSYKIVTETHTVSYIREREKELKQDYETELWNDTYV